ncbi:MAG: CvpA family protein [Proteobacteria bacterium]|nr:CvpA family protein [Pseudomonadota bacterium]
MQFGPAVTPYVGNHPYLAMLIVYLVTSMLIWVVYHRLREFINRLKLREFDRQIGAILGLALGVVACLLVTFFSLVFKQSSNPFEQFFPKSIPAHVLHIFEGDDLRTKLPVHGFTQTFQMPGFGIVFFRTMGRDE